jgi:hypothetical protein
MKIVRCYLHSEEQTIALVDTDTGEFHRENANPRTECGTRVLLGLEVVRWWQASKPQDRCRGFWNRRTSWGIECRVAHPAKIRAVGPRAGFRRLSCRK